MPSSLRMLVQQAQVINHDAPSFCQQRSTVLFNAGVMGFSTSEDASHPFGGNLLHPWQASWSNSVASALILDMKHVGGL